MTPPDSDERKTEREMCTCGSVDVHHKPTCAVVAWLREQSKPDSDEREWWMCVDPTCDKRPHVAHNIATVAISLDLAQRILAALEKWADYDEGEMHDLAAELRAHLPREPK